MIKFITVFVAILAPFSVVCDVSIGYSASATYKINSTTSDAYPVFQQCFNDFTKNGGGSVMIEEGVYSMSSNIYLGGNITIIGAGMDKTILTLQDFASPWWNKATGKKQSGLIHASRVNNLVFKNFTLNGNRQKQNNDKYSEYGRYGFYLEACNNVFIDGVKVMNFQGYGFDPHGIKSSKTYSVNLTIVNSISVNNAWDGFTIDQSKNVTLQNNTSNGNGRHGFNIVTGSQYVSLVNNTVNNNGFWYYQNTKGCGIMIQNNLDFGTSYVSVMYSSIFNSSDSAVCMTEVSNMIVSYNKIDTSSVNKCIRLTNVATATVTNNVCVNAIKGVVVLTSSKVVLANNTIVKLGRKLVL